jgi:uncharacterized protein YndB with AHSA1/START domain
MATKPDYVLQTFIRTTQDALWDALISPEKTQQYYYGSRITTDLRPGGPFKYHDAKGGLLLDGEIVEITPKSRIVSTFIPKWVENAHTTRVTFEIEPMGDLCKFTITHHDVDSAPAGVVPGWAQIASSLKSLLETGEALSYPQEM